ncbi:uncharacterized protein ACA1_128550 [Acanthamoeba castellanii str. Neff]|uniref:Uncharacterized protein n=1 Tax=Acanthamoeba castellanii (strain ATCC 30010 / Neff) TaxID=1257118 RepID=L8GWJ9_ACACF|nr:uncharacterized protein ACA1_128550 [Acanthamoeba castellanii str. Neff]ELR16968.1 hypothetical protein ACA1_128550 [Acanthamoeba castellanii str. Neff]
MPAHTLKWEWGKGFKAPKMCMTCHIPKYEGIKNGPPEKQVKKHICVLQPCKSLTSCLSHHYQECVAHSQELLSCKQKLKDAEEVERQAAAEMAHWEAVQRNQEKAEHCLDCGKIQALLHSMGEDAMWEIFNDSLSESCMKYAK